MPSPPDIQLVALPDLELAWRLYEIADRIEDDDLADDLLEHLSEALERFAPTVERCKLEREAALTWPDDPWQRDRELDSWLDALEERQRTRRRAS